MNKVFISGSSKGLGKALAEAFLEKGDHVVGFSRSSSIVHPNYQHVELDLSQEEAAKAVQFDLKGTYGTFILINNAADLGEISYVGNMDNSLISKTFKLNIIAPFILINNFFKQEGNKKLKKRVLNIGTGAAVNPMDGWSAYCASKAALNMLSSVIDMETKRRESDFIIKTISPGVIDTDMQEQIRASDEKNFSAINRFITFKENKELQRPRETAEKILRNFNSLFNHKEVIINLREFN
jgi:benzil reductase ((S)-benzoin forming)